MAATERQGNNANPDRVRVSNTAANMISSLHPSSKSKASLTLAKIKSSVLDKSKAQRLTGVENAYVVRSGELRVVFKQEGDSVIITSVVTRK